MAQTLRNLIRIHEWRVDERRRKLGELLRLIASLEEQSQRLEAELVREQVVAGASPSEAGYLYGSYAETVIERRERLAESIAKTEEEIAAAREDLNEAYRDLKKFQVAEDSRTKRELKELARKEQAVLDELGARTHMRRHRRGG